MTATGFKPHLRIYTQIHYQRKGNGRIKRSYCSPSFLPIVPGCDVSKSAYKFRSSWEGLDSNVDIFLNGGSAGRLVSVTAPVTASSSVCTPVWLVGQACICQKTLIFHSKACVLRMYGCMYVSIYVSVHHVYSTHVYIYIRMYTYTICTILNWKEIKGKW